MLNDWRETYLDLKYFIDANPEIEINAGMVALPDSRRAEFYRHFDLVRTAFVENNAPVLLARAELLSEYYVKSERAVTEMLALENISLESGLSRFLRAPMEELIRELYTPLFDALKNKITTQDFDRQARQFILASFQSLYYTGYTKWLALSLIQLVVADELLLAIPPEASFYDAHKAGVLQREVPVPRDARRILFNFAPSALFMVPDFIVHSNKLGACLALRTQIGEAFGFAANASPRREWVPFDTRDLGNLLTFIYLADNPMDLSLVADVNRVCRPDLILAVSPGEDEGQDFNKTRSACNALKPGLGTYVISIEPGTDYGADGSIHHVEVGFDQAGLQPVIAALASGVASTGDPSKFPA